jgi:polysaccharide biosynthesis transport protein
MLARVPRLPRRLRRGGVVMLTDPRGPWADAFRRLQTTVGYMQSTLGARVLLVTSPLGGEGTSTVAANLAVAMAQGGKRVVLADLNLRAPTVGPRFGVPTQPGVFEVLTNRIEVGRALSRVALAKGPAKAQAGTLNGQAGTLNVLPAASVAEPPVEYLNTARLADLLTVLSQRADLVLIDAPALLPVSDTMPLAFLADAILIVTRAGVANRTSLGALRASLQGCPAIVLGFVLNAASGKGPALDYDGIDQPLADISPAAHRPHAPLASDEL